MLYIPVSHVLAQILYSGFQLPVICLTISLNPRCFDNECYFQDYETNAKGPCVTNKMSGHFDLVMRTCASITGHCLNIGSEYTFISPF